MSDNLKLVDTNLGKNIDNIKVIVQKRKIILSMFNFIKNLFKEYELESNNPSR